MPSSRFSRYVFLGSMVILLAAAGIAYTGSGDTGGEPLKYADEYGHIEIDIQAPGSAVITSNPVKIRAEIEEMDGHPIQAVGYWKRGSSSSDWFLAWMDDNDLSGALDYSNGSLTKGTLKGEISFSEGDHEIEVKANSTDSVGVATRSFCVDTDNGGDDCKASPPPTDNMCTDGLDSNIMPGADYDGDPDSCVRPDWTKSWEDDNTEEIADHTEGYFWDTDITQTMGDPSSSKSFLFPPGKRKIKGTDGRTEESDPSSPTVTYLKKSKSEGDKWGWAGLTYETNTLSVPPDATTENGRVIYPPHPDGGDNDITCGDGRENEDNQPTGKEGNEAGDEPSTDNKCPGDYGEKWVKYAKYSPQNEFECLDDEATAKASCTGGVSCGCDNSGSESCSCEGSIDTNNDQCNDDSYYEKSYDKEKIVEQDCGETGGYVDSDTATQAYCSFSGTCYETCEKDCNGKDDPVAGCEDGETYETTCSYTSYTSATRDYTCEKGKVRDFSDSTAVDCNSYNEVKGGGNKGKNDPAATFTDFRAYSDSSWTGGSNSVDCDGSNPQGTTWCGYGHTTTIDADGPRGENQGLVAIKDGDVVGSLAHDGGDVGTEFHVVHKGNEYDVSNQDLIDTSCEGGKTACLKYVDFYTKSGGWTTSESSIIPDLSAAVGAEYDTYTPDESYSVCKAINKISDSSDPELRCDYFKNGQPHSPLPEACGDEPGEHVIAMEGPEVNNEKMQSENFLAWEQRCVDEDEDKDVYGEDPRLEDSCLYKGRIYPEGAVIDIHQGDKSWTEKYKSEDKEVCLSIPLRTGTVDADERGDDAGGEWYDLDDEDAMYYMDQNRGGLMTDGLNYGHVADEKKYQHYIQDEMDPGAADWSGVRTDIELAVEDDCYDGLQACQDNELEIDGGPLAETPPYWGPFVEGKMDDDWDRDEVQGVHNRVQAPGQNPDKDVHTGGNDQDTETNLGIADDPQQNSQIDPEDDEWGFSPELDYAISNKGIPKPPEQCHGMSREQGVDRDKTQRIYANSYVRVEDVYTEGPSDDIPDGVWVDPDEYPESVRLGNTSCDLTGKDWGMGYSTDTGSSGSCSSNSAPSASFTVTGTNFLTAEVEATGSDPDGNLAVHAWDWTNDGSYENYGSTASHSYDSSGTYTIKYKAQDSCGASDTATQTVTVDANPVPEGGGSIDSFSFGTEGDRAISPPEPSGPSTGTLCLGNQCTHATGQGPTSFDSDENVNLSKDVMSGTLKTGKLGMKSGTTLCIGKGCDVTKGSEKGHLGEQGAEMDGPLVTSALPTDDSLCIGPDC